MFSRDKSKYKNEVKRLSSASPFPQNELDRMKGRAFILNRFKKNGVGAEIGVFRGHFAEMIAQAAQPSKFYLIDPWTLIGETFGWGKEYTNFGALKTADARQEAIARVKSVSDCDLEIIEDHFPACAHRITEKLDWVYLDASHSYENTLRELRALTQHLKPGATIAGDDWQPDPNHVHYGVFRAVHQFTRETDWRIVMCGPAAQWILTEHKK